MPKNNQGIIERYSMEIGKINDKLRQLENERIYEKTGAKMDGYLVNNVLQLKEMIAELLMKIDKGEESLREQLNSVFKDKHI